MCDEHDRKAEFFLQVFGFLDNLLLDHHVNGCGRLIHDDHLGIQGEGNGNDYSLAHSPGELVGIIHQPLLLNPNQIKQFRGTLDSLGAP